MTAEKRKRVSRDDWLAAGLDMLAEQGVEAVKIDHLARRVGVAKTGFYWHFKDRQDLLEAMLEFWEREYTRVIADNTEIALIPAAERLQVINEVINDHWLNRYDPAISSWARRDQKVAGLLQHTYKIRMDTLRKAFRELGFTGDELEMRTRLYICYVSHEEAMFGEKQTPKTRRMRKLRNRLLIQQLTEGEESP